MYFVQLHIAPKTPKPQLYIIIKTNHLLSFSKYC